MATKKMLLGKELKAFTAQWTVVPNTTKKLTKSQLNTVTITVHTSEYDDGKLYACITTSEGYVNFTIDSRIARRLQDGDTIDPASVRVYDLTNGEKTITRLYGEKK